jgi:nitrate reductase gamma subunit
MLPVGHIYRNNPLMSISSFIFHIGLLIVPIFLINHIDLWKSGTGISWPGLPMWLADVLTILTILSCIILFIFRLLNKSTRALSTGSDYLLLICVGLPFITGFMAMNPSFNPVSYNLIMLIHTLSAELVFVMLPHTKLVHSVLFPFDRISSDIFWQMPAGAGEKIAIELHGSEVKV